MSDICKKLNLSQSGLYSKLNGRTSFSLDEISTLCREYKLSLDYFVFEKNNEETPYSFLSDALRVNPESEVHYIKNIHDHLSQLVGFKNVEATYLTNDIPLFYYTQFPELLSIKLFLWSNTNWDYSNQKSLFDLKEYLDNSELWHWVKNLNKIYNSYPSKELWNSNMLSLLVNQIIYLIDSASFKNSKDIKTILESLEKLIQFFEIQLKEDTKVLFGKKKQGARIQIFLNDLLVNSEMINITSDQFNALYVLYDIPNYLRSYDPRICNHAKNYLQNCLDFCTPINQTGRKDRNRLINGFKKQIELLQTKI